MSPGDAARRSGAMSRPCGDRRGAALSRAAAAWRGDWRDGRERRRLEACAAELGRRPVRRRGRRCASPCPSAALAANAFLMHASSPTIHTGWPHGCVGASRASRCGARPSSDAVVGCARLGADERPACSPIYYCRRRQPEGGDVTAAIPRGHSGNGVAGQTSAGPRRSGGRGLAGGRRRTPVAIRIKMAYAGRHFAVS